MKATTWAARLPWSILLITALLMVVGYLAIARSEELAGGTGRFARQQAVWAVAAGLAMVAATVPRYRVLGRWSYAVFLGALGLLVVVYFCPPVNGARRWIRLGPVGIQPSEVAKIAYVLALAWYLHYRESYRRLRGLLLPFAITLVPVLLILKEPDLGTAAIFLPVLLVMLLVAGARRQDLLAVLIVGLACLPLLWSQMSREQRSRVTALWQQAGPGESPSDDGYHLYQSKKMLAMGGLWGSAWSGVVTDDTAAYRLPESHCDFIFCIVGERFGLVGVGMVLGLYGLLVWRCLAVAMATREPFGRLVAAGVAALIGVQVLVNTAMTVGLTPITGLALPLLSYGGSALVSTGLGLGLLMNVAIRPGYEVGKEPFRYAAE